MNKLILLILIVGIALSFYLFREKEDTKSTFPAESQVATERTGRPDPRNATFIFDDGAIQLSDGRALKSLSGLDFNEEIALLDEFAYGDLNRDGRDDVALLLTRFGGGSGTFVYLGAFTSGPLTYRGSKVIYLGDRVVPKSLSISSGNITVRYLDRRAEEAFAEEPTLEVVKSFRFSNGELLEI